MAKQTLNEAELLLLKHWDEAYLLEQSMDRVREKYNSLFERVAEAVLDAYSAFDTYKVLVTQFWGKGSVGFGRKSWPDSNTNNMPGFWLENLRLEVLASDDEPPPTSSIWISPKVYKKIGIDPQDVRQRMVAAAQEILGKDEFERTVRQDSTGKTVLGFATFEKKDVLDLFVNEGGEGLVEVIVSQFDLLARFAEPLDTILRGKTAAS